MLIVENVLNFTTEHFVAGVFIDLRKTFETVEYNILTQNLENYGVRGIAKD